MSYQNLNYHKVNSALDFPAALEEGRKSLSTVIDQDLDESNLNITDEEKHMLTVLGASFRKINDVDFTIFVCYSLPGLSFLTECQSSPLACPSTVCYELKTTSNEGPLLLSSEGPVPLAQPLSTHPFIESVYNALNCHENDYGALFALCLLYALGKNKGKERKIFVIGPSLLPLSELYLKFSQ